MTILVPVNTADKGLIESKRTMKKVCAQNLSKTELEFQLISQLVFQPIESEAGR